jgi:hypothetical protein
MLTYAMTASLSSLSNEDRKEMIQDQFGRIMKSDDLELETEEKIFTLVKENGEFKLFFNYGEPYKTQLLNQRIEEMEKEAEEYVRTIEYEKALASYKEMTVLDRNNESLKFRLAELESITKKITRLGNDLTLGKLTFEPIKIEIKKIKLNKKSWASDKEVLSEEAYLVLTYQVRNNTDGEVFEFEDSRRYIKENAVYDNYGNEMSEYEMEYDTESVEDYKPRKLAPGETRVVKAVCEAPLSQKVEKFLWKVRLYIDNKKTED